MKNVGFTGTRHGMTLLQHGAMRQQVLDLGVNGIVAHHGDCIGADAQFHRIVRQEIGGWIVGHLPADATHAAGCEFDEKRDPLTHMKRNREIVRAADVMLAAPFDMEEQERGGTWATIRMARKAKKPLRIVWPNGAVTIEEGP